VFHLATLRHRLTAIWLCWSGIKHIYEPNGWPFPQLPAFNDHLLTGDDWNVIFIQRRNAGSFKR
jgi:hypothetical protein